MIPKSTPELLKFYKDWLAAATKDDADLNEHPVFRNDLGLCGNLEMWCEEDFCEEDPVANKAYLCMLSQFQHAGLNTTYPFGEMEYHKGYWSDDQHKDPKRLAWVEARISDMEEI